MVLNIGLTGSTGRMGLHLVDEVVNQKNHYSLAQALVRNESKITHELRNCAKEIINQVNQFNKVDIIIDFSSPNLSLEILEHCSKQNIPTVICTTGFNDLEKKAISKFSEKIPVILAANTSLSVNMLFKLVTIAATSLPKYEAEIIEAHHRYKKDAPSGTAIKLGEAIANARDIDFNANAIFARTGRDNEIRKPQDIGFSAIRGGDIVGQHEIMFINDGEILSFKSQINNRKSFAQGALLAADFLYKKPSGLYTMFDVLGI